MDTETIMLWIMIWLWGWVTCLFAIRDKLENTITDVDFTMSLLMWWAAIPVIYYVTTEIKSMNQFRRKLAKWISPE